MKESLLPGYGQLLARARNAKGMSLADVAAKIKLTVRQVQAMEAEDTEHLPGEIFLRGFVRNYARLVELDPDEVIVPMDADAAVSETITAHSEGVTMGSGGLKRWLIVPLVVFGVFVIFVAVLYQWLRQGEDALVPQEGEPSTQAVVTQPAPLPAGDQAPEKSPVVAETGGSNVPPAPATQAEDKPDERELPGAAANPAPAEAVLTPMTSEVQHGASPTASSPGANNHVLRFQTDQDAWIQVVDGEGRRFSKLIRAGTTDSITGTAPFKLVVGEAARVRLSYDGHSIDLTPFIGQKVARLTLE